MLLALAPRASGQSGTDPSTPKLSLAVLLSDVEPLRDREAREAELFYAAVRAEWTRKHWGARAEVRGKDGRFRPYFRGDIWLEEGYAYLTTKLGEVRVGKLERETFLADDTFGGNLLSLNGFEYDLLSWSLVYFGQNDHVAFERDGVGVESDPAAKLRDGLEARGSYKVNKGLTTFTPGVSVATARIVPDAGAELRRTDVGADVTATLGPLSAALGVVRRKGDDGRERLGYHDAWAGILAIRAEFPTVVYRYTYTEWRYGGAAFNERLHQPAAVWNPVKGIEATIEYEARRLRSPSGARVFNAFRFGLTLAF